MASHTTEHNNETTKPTDQPSASSHLDAVVVRQRGGQHGLDAFDQEHTPATAGAVAVAAPGRELARLAITSGGDRVRRATELLVPLAAALPPRQADELLDQAEAEMTRQGWNPHGQFTTALARCARTTSSSAPRDWDVAAGAPCGGVGHRAGPGVVPILA